MFWPVLAVCAVFLAFCIAFGLGAALGASSTQEQFIENIVPVISAIGGWVSGIGALGAVLATLWLADKQRREDVEDLRINSRSVLITGEDSWLIGVEVVSTGRRPAVVTSVAFSSPLSEKELFPLRGHPGISEELPKKLSYGERVGLFYGERLIEKLAQYIERYCEGRGDIEVVVSTTLNTFRAKMSQELVVAIMARGVGVY